MVTFGFNKENPRNYPTPSSHQSRGKSTNVAPPKAKGAKLNLSGGSTSYSIQQSGKNKCWKCGGPHKKKNCPNPLQTITFNLNPTQPCCHCHVYGHDASHFTQNYIKVSHKTPMSIKAKVLGRAIREKVWLTKGRPPRRPQVTQGQPNTMEARFTQLEAVVTLEEKPHF